MERRISACVAVSIHAPTGGATKSALTASGALAFQFTRPRGARHPRLKALMERLENVSIHAPTGGATPALSVLGAAASFQFTHPRGARPLAEESVLETDVSIHAPTGGATRAGDPLAETDVVSIHAPTGGATPGDLRPAPAA